MLGVLRKSLSFWRLFISTCRLGETCCRNGTSKCVTVGYNQKGSRCHTRRSAFRLRHGYGGQVDGGALDAI